jgi:ABC-type antimicrobial peptide transport system permease subunit
VGLGAVLLRSAAERRRELALLRAIGYKPADFFTMTLAENGLLLATGLAIGAACALVAIAPALMERGGQLPSPALIALLAATLIAGLFTALVATAAVLRSPLLSALRSE